MCKSFVRDAQKAINLEKINTRNVASMHCSVPLCLFLLYLNPQTSLFLSIFIGRVCFLFIFIFVKAKVLYKIPKKRYVQKLQLWFVEEQRKDWSNLEVFSTP